MDITKLETLLADFGEIVKAHQKDIIKKERTLMFFQYWIWRQVKLKHILNF